MSAVPLALTGDQWIALAGLGSGAILGVASLVFSYFNSRAERSHARTLARQTRLHEQRLEAYEQLSATLERERLYVQRTEPITSVPGEAGAPEPLSEEGWLALQGRVSVTGSAEVDAAVTAARQAAFRFMVTAALYRNAQGQPPTCTAKAARGSRWTRRERPPTKRSAQLSLLCARSSRTSRPKRSRRRSSWRCRTEALATRSTFGATTCCASLTCAKTCSSSSETPRAERGRLRLPITLTKREGLQNLGSSSGMRRFAGGIEF